MAIRNYLLFLLFSLCLAIIVHARTARPGGRPGRGHHTGSHPDGGNTGNKPSGDWNGKPNAGDDMHNENDDKENSKNSAYGGSLHGSGSKTNNIPNSAYGITPYLPLFLLILI